MSAHRILLVVACLALWGCAGSSTSPAASSPAPSPSVPSSPVHVSSRGRYNAIRIVECLTDRRANGRLSHDAPGCDAAAEGQPVAATGKLVCHPRRRASRSVGTARLR